MRSIPLTVRRGRSGPAPAPAAMLALKLAVAEAAAVLARRTGRGGGTSLPGRVLLHLAPDAIAVLATRLRHGSAAISATNGKTTTAAMAAAILRRDGTRLVHNHTGANMPGGVATALATAARRARRGQLADLGLFEVDELWLPTVAEQLEPRVVLLGNLFRDQLDRSGELDSIAERWAKLVATRRGATRFVVCGDDPAVASVGEEAPDTVYYGLDDAAQAGRSLPHAADSTSCTRCGDTYAYQAVYLAHLGDWSCSRCSSARPPLAVTATDVVLQGLRSAAFTLRAGGDEARVELPLPGLYNVYNALGAAALCLTLGVDLGTVAAGLATVEPAFGRAETVVVGGRPVILLLVKNPAGADQVIRTLTLESGPLDLLAVLNDGIADGRDVSWIWDVDWEALAPHVGRVTCSGSRAADLALRLKHAGVPAERLHVVEGVAAALDHAVGRSSPTAEAPAGTDPPPALHVLPTYTAMLELREALAAAGHTGLYWQ